MTGDEAACQSWEPYVFHHVILRDGALTLMQLDLSVRSSLREVVSGYEGVVSPVS